MKHDTKRLFFYIFVVQLIIAGIMAGYQLPISLTLYIIAGVNVVLLLGYYGLFITDEERIAPTGLLFLKLIQKYLFVVSIVVLIGVLLINVIDILSLVLPVRPFALTTLILGTISSRALVNGKIYYGKRRMTPVDYIGYAALGVMIAVMYITQPFQIVSQLFLGLLCGGLFFVLSVGTMKLLSKKSVRKLLSTRLFMIGIVGSGLGAGRMRYSSLNTTYIITTHQQLRDFMKEDAQESVETLVAYRQDGNTKTLNLDELGALDNEIIVKEREEDALPTIGEIEENLVSTDSLLTGTEEVLLGVDTTNEEPLTFADIIPSLLEQNDVALTERTTVQFTYIAPTNTLYPAFATAYAMKLIGKNINPENQVSCDTYLVMKGIVEGRVVSGNGNIFTQYRETAQERGATNECNKGEYVKITTQ